MPNDGLGGAPQQWNVIHYSMRFNPIEARMKSTYLSNRRFLPLRHYFSTLEIRLGQPVLPLAIFYRLFCINSSVLAFLAA